MRFSAIPWAGQELFPNQGGVLLTGILVWWLLITGIGLAALPITLKVFSNLPDRGYAFSKSLGLLLLGLLAWLVGFLNFSLLSLVFCLALLAAFSWWVWSRYQSELRTILAERLGQIFLTELFFAGLFLMFVFFRMFNPEIIGTEKFMDMAFLNSLTRNPSFPPYDPWLSGSQFFISYYYFGYLLMAILVKLSGVVPAVGFNLSLALLFSLSGLAVWGLLYNLTRKITLAFGGFALLYLLGNLDGFRQVLETGAIANFNWWTPSRVIPDTINEFPFFSFLLGDMHPHMLAVPFFILSMALALNQAKSDLDVWTWEQPEQWGRWLLWGLVIGSLGFLNSWDLPTALAMAGMAFFIQHHRRRPRLASWPWKNLGLGFALILAAAFVPFYPFYATFHSQAKGIGLTHQNTRIAEYLLIFGLFTFLAVSFLAARYHAWFVALLAPAMEKKAPTKSRAHCPQCGIPVREGKEICGKCGFQISRLPDQAAEAGSGAVQEVPAWLKEIWLVLLQPVRAFAAGKKNGPVYGLAGFLAVLALAVLLKSVFLGLVLLLLAAAGLLVLARSDSPEVLLSLGWIGLAWLLIAGCELLHVRDTFEPPLDRMNTVFKFYYQAWFLLGIGSVSGLHWMWRNSLRNPYWRAAWTLPLVCLILAASVYPLASIGIKTNHFRNPPTLDGSEYLNLNYPADRDGIEWLRRHVKGSPVVLEATGNEYTDFARVSTYTGLPTVLGWAGHELQWRGNWDEPGRRLPDIDTLYTTTDLEKTRQLLDKYQIQYVFVGTLERDKHPGPGLNKFRLLMDTVFDHPGGVTIYKRR